MATSTIHENVIEQVTPAMRQPLRQFAALVEEVAGGELQAIVLFGAVCGPSFTPQHHTAHSVAVLSAFDLEVLRRLAEHGPRLGKQHIRAPLVMTPEYVEDSRDTFPLELIDIQQNHSVLLGADHFADLTFSPSDVRLQCEREIKVILMGLRQGVLAAAGRARALAALETDVADGILRTLRGFLWLKDSREAKPGADVLAEVEKAIGGRLDGLQSALDPAATHDWSALKALYNDVEAVGKVVEGL